MTIRPFCFLVFAILAVGIVSAQEPSLTSILKPAIALDGKAEHSAMLSCGYTPLFNGQDLSGWRNPYPHGEAKVVDGEIHLLSDEKFFLVTEKKYSDFRVSIEIHLPEGPANSGVMFRCHVDEDAPKKKVYGNQAECDGSDRRWSGGLYDESRRGWIWPSTQGRSEEQFLKHAEESKAAFAVPTIANALNRNGWNRFVITAVEDFITIEVNGVPALATLGTPEAIADEPLRQPDIVVYLADDLSAVDLSLYGGTNISTPAIDQLAADGMTFNRAFVASPSCAPSRAALLTGLMPARNGAEENHSYPREDILRLPQILNKLGYQTAAFGKVAHQRSAPDYHFETHDGKQNIPSLRKSVKDFLENRTDKRPLALFVGVSDPHVPWSSESSVDPAVMSLPPQLLDTPRTRYQRSRYLQEVKNLDAYLGELRELTGKHLSKDTLFVFSSDHGAQFPFGKWTLYDEGIHVPLVVARNGKIQSGARTEAMVSWVDLLPTLIEVGGGEVPENLDGRSFASVLDGETDTHRDRIFTTHSGDREMNVYLSRSIRTDRYKLIYNPHPEFAFTTHIDLLLRETSGDYFKQWTQLAKTDPQAAGVLARFYGRPEYELFDLEADPHELTNLAGEPELAEIQQELSDELKAWIKEQGDELTVFHQPLMLAAPQTWVPRKK